MDPDLLRRLLAAFPNAEPQLVVRGYRVPWEPPVDDLMLRGLADHRPDDRELLTGFDRG